jgi:hypothetical protein
MDWTYNFLQDTEPSEMQLEMLMYEVVEDARKRREKANKKLKQLIDKEIQLADKRRKSLIKSDN